jgi:hypothetical protein
MASPNIYANIIKSFGGASPLIGPCPPVYSVNGSATPLTTSMQVGYATTNAAGTVTITYTFAFPTITDFVLLSNISGGLSNVSLAVGSGSGTNAGFSVFAANPAGAGVAVSFYWLAIGH